MPHSPIKTISSRIFFLIIILGCGISAYFYFENDKEKIPFLTKEVKKTPPKLEIGKRYRVFIRSIIVPPTNHKGKKWDGNGKNSAPDVFFRIFYLDHMIYESSTIDDVLVAEFSAVKGGITDAILSKNASDYLEAANVAYVNESSYFKVEVIDSDSFNNDTIGNIKVNLKDLEPGSNKIEHNGLSYVLTIIDADTDINESLKALKVIK